jgi:hypothetical protein
MKQRELIERLAEQEHVSWSHWMHYLFSRSTTNADGSMTIPSDLALRWQRQAETPYAELSEREQQSDRNRVALILPMIEAYRAMQKRRALQVAALVMVFTGGMIAGQLLLFRDVLLAEPESSLVRVTYLIEDAFFFLSAGIIALLTIRHWWPYVWHGPRGDLGLTTEALIEDRGGRVNDLLKHPLWTNKAARYACICLIFIPPLSIIGEFFTSFRPVFATIGLILCLVILVQSFRLVRQTDAHIIAREEQRIKAIGVDEYIRSLPDVDLPPLPVPRTEEEA